jgi:hypothetical protein
MVFREAGRVHGCPRGEGGARFVTPGRALREARAPRHPRARAAVRHRRMRTEPYAFLDRTPRDEPVHRRNGLRERRDHALRARGGAQGGRDRRRRACAAPTSHRTSQSAPGRAATPGRGAHPKSMREDEGGQKPFDGRLSPRRTAPVRVASRRHGTRCFSTVVGGVDGTRTRGLRRDRRKS